MISFSGIDCCGKTTQIQLLCDELKARDQKYLVVWSRGGYTPGLSKLKDLIRGKKKTADKEQRADYSQSVNKNPRKRKILFIASLIDMWWFYSVTLRLKELFGTKSICDRYIWDTYVDYKLKYPDYDFERGFWWKLTLKMMVKPKPSICMFIPAEVSMYRSSLKEEPFPEAKEVREARIKLYEEEMTKNRWSHLIDANRPIEEVRKDVYSAVGFR